MFVAVVGDILASRKINDRHAFQRRFLDAVGSVNRRGHTVSPYTVTLGDEFQALYENADGLFDDISVLIARLHPVRLRISVGIGAIDTDINRSAAIGMDGPAFHLARAAIDALKTENGTLAINAQRPDAIGLIKSASELWSFVTSSWRPRR